MLICDRICEKGPLGCEIDFCYEHLKSGTLLGIVHDSKRSTVVPFDWNFELLPFKYQFVAQIMLFLMACSNYK